GAVRGGGGEVGGGEGLEGRLDRGADINSPSDLMDGIGGQTPIFHAIGTIHAAGVVVLEHLVRRGDQRVDLSLRGTFRLFDEPQTPAMTAMEFAEVASRAAIPEFRRASARARELLKSLAVVG